MNGRCKDHDAWEKRNGRTEMCRDAMWSQIRSNRSVGRCNSRSTPFSPFIITTSSLSLSLFCNGRMRKVWSFSSQVSRGVKFSPEPILTTSGRTEMRRDAMWSQIRTNKSVGRSTSRSTPFSPSIITTSPLSLSSAKQDRKKVALLSQVSHEIWVSEFASPPPNPF